MKKIPFLTLEKAKEIREQIPTPFYVYDEADIRANAHKLMSPQARKAAIASGRAVEVAADDFQG